MPKKKKPLKRGKKTRSRVSPKTKPKKPRRAKPTLKERIARAKKLEALDAGKPTFKVLPRALIVAPDNVPTAPPPVITGSVGRWEKGASNLEADVKTVQRLLETAAQKLQAPDLDPKGVDGKIARDSAKSNTVAAIEAFQKRSNISIDGLIEPDSQTWQALVQAAGSNNVASTSLAVITASVGRWEKGAPNIPADVESVQRLLQTAAQRLQAPQLDPKGVDGKIARPPAKSNTVAAIEAFQSLSNISITGLIEPDSQAWRALLQGAGET